MFQNVPYDVLPLLFEHLDQESLLNVVLVNRTFNEAASPVLYSNLLLEFVSLTWDTDDFEPEGLRRNPFQAFERRPGLRNAVRNVDITTRYDKPIKATDPTTLKALCHKEFSLFCNIRSISINGGYYEWADSSFLWCIVQDIETLQVLKLGDLSNSATLFFPNVKEFECRVWRPNKLGIGSYANRVHKLDFYSLSYDLGDFKPFSNLRVLILGRIKLPLQNGSLSVLASFPALTHLRLSPIIITSSLDFQHSYQPTNLTRLTHLTISLSQRDPTFIDSTLCWLVKSIAGHSRLTSLAIVGDSHTHVIVRCERLMHHIWTTHGHTLQRLKLPFFNVSRTLLLRISSHVPNLVQLWIGATLQMKTWLSDVLSTFIRLERLRLYHIGTFEFSYSCSFLQQVCPTLKVFKICQRNRFYTSKYGRLSYLTYVWKKNWLYDEQSGAMRRTQGPKTAERLCPEVAYKYLKSEYASDSDSETNQS